MTSWQGHWHENGLPRVGYEPTTSPLHVECSNHWAISSGTFSSPQRCYLTTGMCRLEVCRYDLVARLGIHDIGDLISERSCYFESEVGSPKMQMQTSYHMVLMDITNLVDFFNTCLIFMIFFLSFLLSFCCNLASIYLQLIVNSFEHFADSHTRLEQMGAMIIEDAILYVPYKLCGECIEVGLVFFAECYLL